MIEDESEPDQACLRVHHGHRGDLSVPIVTRVQENITASIAEAIPVSPSN